MTKMIPNTVIWSSRSPKNVIAKIKAKTNLEYRNGATTEASPMRVEITMQK